MFKFMGKKVNIQTYYEINWSNVHSDCIQTEMFTLDGTWYLFTYKQKIKGT